MRRQSIAAQRLVGRLSWFVSKMEVNNHIGSCLIFAHQIRALETLQDQWTLLSSSLLDFLTEIDSVSNPSHLRINQTLVTRAMNQIQCFSSLFISTLLQEIVWRLRVERIDYEKDGCGGRNVSYRSNANTEHTYQQRQIGERRESDMTISHQLWKSLSHRR
jgi:hypothetical protein